MKPPRGNTMKLQKATFAAGCFWGVEELFRKLPGVKSTAVGYTGGKTGKPAYEGVCTGATGHAESVEITFDQEKISYKQLLAIFWAGHDPTTPNRQGPDSGSQYRSAIFFHNQEQGRLAMETKENLERGGKWKNTIVTQIVPAGKFWRAEECHQKYLMKRGEASCHF